MLKILFYASLFVLLCFRGFFSPHGRGWARGVGNTHLIKFQLVFRVKLNVIGIWSMWNVFDADTCYVVSF